MGRQICIYTTLLLIATSQVFGQCLGTIPDTLVGYYPMSGNAGDSSGQAPINHGTANGGVSFSDGVIGDAAFFDGINDYVILNQNFDLDSAYTFTAWIKPTSMHVGNIFSMRKQCSSYGGGFNQSLISIGGTGQTNSPPLYMNNASFTTYNQIVISMSRVNSACSGWHSSYSYTVPDVAIDTTCWTHIAVVVEENAIDTARHIVVYVNGIPYDVANHHVTTAANNANAISAFATSLSGYYTYLGYNHNVTSQPGQNFPYHGGIDAVYIHERALDSCEVNALFNLAYDTSGVSIGVSNTQICVGETDSFWISTIDSLQASYWLVDDSLMSSSDTFIYTFNQAGTVLVQLVYQHAIFCPFDTISFALQVNPNDTTNLSLSACIGDSVFLENAWQNTAGTYTDQFLGQGGCDSLVITTLSFSYSEFDTINLSLCFGDSFYFNNVWVSQTGVYFDTIPGQPCDTVLSLNLNFVSIIIDTVQVSICQGDSFYVQGEWQFNVGFFADSFITSLGCDSVMVTELSLFWQQDKVQHMVCFGDSIFLADQWITSSGSYLDTLEGPCDTIRNHQVTILNLITSVQSLSICSGDSILLGESFQQEAGTYIDTLTSAFGCDSIRTTIVNLTYASKNVPHSFCQGGSFMLNGTSYTQSTTVVDTIEGAPCDTIVNHVISMLPTTYSYETQTRCVGDSVYLAGDWRFEPGSFSETLINVQQCDSVRTIALQFYWEELSINANICAGEIYGPSQMTYDSTAKFRDTARIGACRTIRRHKIKVNQPFITETLSSICDGDSLFVGGAWQTNSGVYIDSLIRLENGCDSIVFHSLSIEAYATVLQAKFLCRNDSIYLGGKYHSKAGIYRDTMLLEGSSCPTIVETTVSISNTTLQEPHISVLDSGYCPNPIFKLDAGVSEPGILWLNKLENHRVIDIRDTGWVHMEYRQCGHIQADSIYLPSRDCNCSIYFPNSFTPDSDQFNDGFAPVFDCPFVYYEFIIFDRWGHPIFTSNDESDSWDGTINGLPVQIGNYFFNLNYSISGTNPTDRISGTVNLLR
jgi:gliding motility-associated-like protein